MSNLLRSVQAVAVAGLVAACASGGVSSTSLPSVTPATAAPTTSSAVPSATPLTTQSGIPHPTRPMDVVLRLDESGGFVPVEFNASHLPYFTLYGDGTVVFLQTFAPVEPVDGVSPGTPIRTARLTEAQMQDLLEFAIADGGLGIARAEYPNPMVADAPTAVFELNADGRRKHVSVVALGMEGDPGPDSAVKASLAKLGERLRDFDHGGSLSSDAYRPAGYRAVLFDATNGAGGRVRDWPWTGLTLADFAFPADPNQLQQGTRVMTPAEIEAVGLTRPEDGVQSGLVVKGPDGKAYTLVIRPLLPDEAA
jgi:hypothetical protein